MNRVRRQPPRRYVFAATLGSGLLLLVGGCGQLSGFGSGDDGCPSGAEIDAMSSEELNQIPKRCDENMREPRDQPGVTVNSDDRDDRDGRPSDEALESFGPPGDSISATLERDEDIDFRGLEWPGGPIELLATSAGGLARVVLADLQGRPVLGAEGARASARVRGTVPAGRYLVKIFFGSVRQTPLNYHVWSGTPTS